MPLILSQGFIFNEVKAINLMNMVESWKLIILNHRIQEAPVHKKRGNNNDISLHGAFGLHRNWPSTRQEIGSPTPQQKCFKTELMKEIAEERLETRRLFTIEIFKLVPH